ncbi:MAG: trypsin-like serine peptidase [Parvularculaceae bacterium]
MNYVTEGLGSEDDLSSGNIDPPTQGAISKKPASRGESAHAAPEVAGDPPISSSGGEGGEAGGSDQNAEVENAGSESGEETLEASAAQLSAETGEESAFSDLEGTDGFAPPSSSEAGLDDGASEATLADAGEALGTGEAGDAEFAFLAALVPALVSAVGPGLGKAIGRKLKPRTLVRLKRIVPKVATALTGLPRGVTRGNIMAILARLLTAAQSAPAGESATEVDEGVADEAAAVLEVIIGRDDRVRITNTTGNPWRRICALKIHFPSGRVYRGTGFFIGPRTVATAGHCVYLHEQGGWARKVEVSPGSNGAARPYGTATSVNFRSVRGWVSDRRPESDYGCIVLPAGSFGSRNLGQFGFAAFPPAVLVACPAVLAGYPGDKPFAELWGMARKIKTVTPTQLIYDIDTAGGQSGSGVYIKRNGQRFVVGIHNYGAQSGNSATRITQPVYQRLLAWRQL